MSRIIAGTSSTVDSGRCSVVGPAEFFQSLREVRERQADNIEVAAFDPRNEPAAAPLNGVSAGFVIRLVCRQILDDVIVGKRSEVNERGFHKTPALGIRESNQRD